MRAAVLREVDAPLTIEDVQIDDPGPNEVVIRTVASGVCHSNLHYMEGKYTFPMPTILGDEAAGVIEAVGSMVDYVKPGDHVITCLSVFCGMCDKCLSGNPHLCRRKGMERSPSAATSTSDRTATGSTSSPTSPPLPNTCSSTKTLLAKFGKTYPLKRWR